MNEAYNIARLLKLLLRKSPLILGVMIGAVILARQAVKYITPVYEATVRIKLDDLYSGFSNSNLFKDFDVFTTDNKIKTEVELLSSQLLINLALEKLDFDISYFRVGHILTSEIYHDTPFKIKKLASTEDLDDRTYDLKIIDHHRYVVSGVINGISFEKEGVFGASMPAPLEKLSIALNEGYLSKNSAAKITGVFKFRLNSMGYIRSNVVGDNLKIKEIDKDVAVIRLNFRNVVPEKTALFVNTLAETYIEDYINSKVDAAEKTVNFLDHRLAVVSANLRDAERDLERFKKDNDVVNILQETETGLRKISQLKVQLIGLEMDQAALDSLYDFISNNPAQFFEKAPSFEQKGGLLFAELVKAMRALSADKKDKLLKYQPDNPIIVNIDSKISDIIGYIQKDIENHSHEIAVKRSEIEKSIEAAEAEFDDLPTTEKNLVVLQREFKINQSIYNFLKEKKIEAEIQKASTISFHRIIEKADVPKAPISPNKAFAQIVAGFLGFTFSVCFVLIRNFINPKVRDRYDIEKKSASPVLGVVTKSGNSVTDDSMRNVINIMDYKSMLAANGNVITICEVIGRNNQGIFAPKLAQLLSTKYKVAFLSEGNDGMEWDMYRAEGNPQRLLHINISGLKNALRPKEELTQLTDQLKKDYDYIIIGAPALRDDVITVNCLLQADSSLLVSRCNRTTVKALTETEQVIHDYQLKHVCHVLMLGGGLLSGRSTYDGRATKTSNNIIWVLIKRISRMGI